MKFNEILKTDSPGWFSSGVHLLVFRTQEAEMFPGVFVVVYGAAAAVAAGSHRLMFPSLL